VITLSASEMMLAAQAGVMRTVQNLVQGTVGAHGSETNDWSMSIEGALAEWAASKALGIHWPGKGQMRGADAGNLQIRSTRNPAGSLILHRGDRDEDLFILMVGQASQWEPKGWIRAASGKQGQFWRTDIRSPAFLVPQSELMPMVDLIG
jgi:hypothetical protein